MLPIPKKTYQIVTLANSLLGVNRTNQLDMVLKVHAQRKAWGFIIRGSGDGITAAMDGVDRWISVGNFPTASNGVWMVYENPITGAQDLLQPYDFGESDYVIVHSPDGGFTGGSTVARPSAPHETILYNNSFFGRGEGGGDPQFVCHMWLSPDFEVFRQSYWWNHIPFANIFYDKVEDPTPGWALPHYGLVDRNGHAIDSDQTVGDVTRWMNEFAGGGTGVFQSAWGPGGQMQMTATVEGTGVGNVLGRTQPLNTALTTKNQISNTYRFLPTSGLYRCEGFSDSGWHGRVFDCWWIPHLIFTPGVTTPIDGSNEFVLIKDQLHVWNGTIFRTI